MKSRHMIAMLIAFFGIAFAAVPAGAATPAETLDFSCSAQVYDAFGPEVMKAFTDETGIPVDLYVASSTTALNRLMNDYAELATSTTRLYRRHQEYGYTEIVFASDPLVVFTNKEIPVKSLSKSQILDIFSGTVNNWKEVGGPDHFIVSIVPEKQTGAYQNFRSLVMGGMDIEYDFMSYRSTMVVEAARRFPYVISFITRAAVANDPEIKVLSVDKISPDSEDYPYFQTFSFVTKGDPEGPARQFIDFVVKGKGRDMLKKKGLTMMVK